MLCRCYWSTVPHPNPSQISTKHVGKSILLHFLTPRCSSRRLRTVTLYILNTLFSHNTFIGKKATRIPTTMRSKTRVCGRSLAGVAGSNPAGGMDVCLFECCVWGLCDKPIPRPEESYKLSCMCLCLCVTDQLQQVVEWVCVCQWIIICQSNLSVTGRSLVQKSPNEWCVFVCVCVCVGHWFIIFKSNLSATDRSLVERSPTDCGVCVCVCVCVCVSLINSNSNPLHLQGVGR